MAAVLLSIAAPACAQYLQQGGKLVASGTVGAPAAGASVAISADGNTALLGGPVDNLSLIHI